VKQIPREDRSTTKPHKNSNNWWRVERKSEQNEKK
jgi:hypothetical protein